MDFWSAPELPHPYTGRVLYAQLIDLTVGGNSPAALESSDSREPKQQDTSHCHTGVAGSLLNQMHVMVQMTYLDAMSELLDSPGQPTCQTCPTHKASMLISMSNLSVLSVASLKTAVICSLELGSMYAVYQHF